MKITVFLLLILSPVAYAELPWGACESALQAFAKGTKSREASDRWIPGVHKDDGRLLRAAKGSGRTRLLGYGEIGRYYRVKQRGETLWYKEYLESAADSLRRTDHPLDLPEPEEYMARAPYLASLEVKVLKRLEAAIAANNSLGIHAAKVGSMITPTTLMFAEPLHARSLCSLLNDKRLDENLRMLLWHDFQHRVTALLNSIPGAEISELESYGFHVELPDGLDFTITTLGTLYDASSDEFIIVDPHNLT